MMIRQYMIGKQYIGSTYVNHRCHYRVFALFKWFVLVYFLVSMTSHAYGQGFSEKISPIEFEEVCGQIIPSRTHANDTDLYLNGIGLRTHKVLGFSVKVYLVALYTEELSNNPEEIIHSDSSKLFDIYFLRDVDSNKLRNSWEWNDGLIEQGFLNIEQLHEASGFQDAVLVDLRKGQRMTIQVIDDQTNFLLDGRLRHTYHDPLFSRAVLGVYLLTPPNDDLIGDLLGRTSVDC